MKVKTITFSQSNESVNSIGLHKWNKFDAVAELDDTDNEDVCALNLAAKVEMWHQRLNPQINWLSGQPMFHPPTEEKSTYTLDDKCGKITLEKPIGLTVDDIHSCQDKITLESYRLLVRNKPELEAAFLEKLKEFI